MRILLLAVWAALTACVSPPKTANEFRRISRGRQGTHKKIVNAPLATVMNRITAHAQKCSSFGWSMTRREGLGGNPASSRYSDRQLVRWENSKSNKPTFVL